MKILSQANCEACNADALLIDDNEAQQLLRQLLLHRERLYGAVNRPVSNIRIKRQAS